jgi:Glycosyl hydrolase family 115
MYFMSVAPAFAMLLRRAAACSVLSLLVCPAAWTQSSNAEANIAIDSSVTIVESPQEPGPVRRATDDLLRDFTRVFGQAPRLVGQLEQAGPVFILIAGNSSLPAGVKCSTAADTEAFAFSTFILPGHGKSKRLVCLTGADMRGTIFAIYQFSQSCLGVDPMYLWTDKQPEKRKSITLPAGFARIFPKPAFKYRGFFPNDEDLLTGWAPAAAGEQTGISLKVWDNIYETTLRLKGNMVVPGTWIFPDDAQVHAATERGLIVNQHHAIPLGVNVAHGQRTFHITCRLILKSLNERGPTPWQLISRTKRFFGAWACAVCLTRAMRRSIPASATTTRCLASA